MRPQVNLLAICLLGILVQIRPNFAQSKPLKLNKCCPEGQVYDVLSRGKCMDWNVSSQLEADYDINPAIQVEYDTYYEGQSYEDVAYQDPTFGPFEFMDIMMPHCHEDSDVVFLLNRDNVPVSFVTYEFNGKPVLFDNKEKTDHDIFCVDRGVQFYRDNQPEFKGTIALACRVRDEVFCSQHNCIRSCCDFTLVHDPTIEGIDKCRPSKNPDPGSVIWSMPYHDLHTDKVLDDVGLTRDFYGYPCSQTLEYHNPDDYKLYKGGIMKVVGELHNYTNYCVTLVEDASNATGEGFVYSMEVSICAEDDPYSKGYNAFVRLVDFKILPILMGVSLVFLALLFEYIRRNHQHKLFGAMMLCVVSMLFLFYLVNMAVKLAGDDHIEKYPIACELEGLLIQFSYLSAVFWLNAMSINIWNDFRRMTPINTNRGQGSPRSGIFHPRFKWYALYAWGLPFIILAVTILMQHLPSDTTKQAYVPGIGRLYCFLNEKYATLFYFHIISAPILLANVVLFLCFIYNFFFGVWAMTVTNVTDQTLREQNRTKLHTAVKMFFVMGLTWTAEVLDWALGWAYGSHRVYHVTVVFNAINALQGLTMFCVIYFDSTRLKRIVAGIKKCSTGNNRVEPKLSRNQGTVRTEVTLDDEDEECNKKKIMNSIMYHGKRGKYDINKKQDFEMKNV